MRFDDLYTQVGPSIEGPMPLVILTDGWLEACDTLARVRDLIQRQCDLTPIAQFDTDQLLDQRARRPMLSVYDGVTQGVEWPELDLAVGTDANGVPFMVLHGPEPDFAWRQFGKAVANVAASVGVTSTYALGAYPAPAPHTRPMRISSTASRAETLVGLDHTSGHLRVPVGVQVAITEELERFGVPSHGMFAQVPYYITSHDWPQAALAMLEFFSEVTGLAFDTSQLAAQVPDALAAVEAMMLETPSLNEVVTRLEQRFDELKKLEDDPLPSGDELEEELQQYLRKIDGD